MNRLPHISIYIFIIYHNLIFLNYKLGLMQKNIKISNNLLSITQIQLEITILF